MMILFFLVASLSQLPGFPCAVITAGDWTVFAGDSITIPCPYPPEYTLNVKYWCQGYFQDFCTSLARTDEPNTAGRVTIADDPTQQVFSVTMHEMKENESGWYWCRVEIRRSKDIGTPVYISVKQGISVKNNKVSAEEGDSVTVQCHYSGKHREDEKKWCRSGNVKSCTVTNNGNFSSKSLLISDNRKDAFNVTMRQLEIRDAGWYYCGAGEHQVSVHVLVTSRSTTTTTVNTTVAASVTTNVPASVTTKVPASVTTTMHSHIDKSTGSQMIYWCLAAFLLLLVILVIITCLVRKERINRTKELRDDTTVHPGKKQPTVLAEDSIIYSTVANAKPKVSPNDDADHTIYSTVVHP